MSPFLIFFISHRCFLYWNEKMCACMCVCLTKRKRERERTVDSAATQTHTFCRVLCMSDHLLIPASPTMVRVIIKKKNLSWILWMMLEVEVQELFYFICYSVYTLLSCFGKLGPPYLGKLSAAARAALPSPTSTCWFFSCFRNPPANSDMDYRIFNVRTW